MRTTSLVKRVVSAGIAGVAVVSFGAAIAQTAVSPSAKKTAPAASAQDSSKPVTATQIENWTTSQWEAAKKEWEKNTAKWVSCREQSNKQKLEVGKAGRFFTPA